MFNATYVTKVTGKFGSLMLNFAEGRWKNNTNTGEITASIHKRLPYYIEIQSESGPMISDAIFLADSPTPSRNPDRSDGIHGMPTKYNPG